MYLESPIYPLKTSSCVPEELDYRGVEAYSGLKCDFRSEKTQKKLREMFVHTVMLGHVIRYLVNVRVCYLLLGWW
jgi:hypothetical protein